MCFEVLGLVVLPPRPLPHTGQTCLTVWSWSVWWWLSRWDRWANTTGDGHTAVQGLRFSCYSWAPGYHSWTREPRHPVHVTDVYATESRTPPVLELSADRFSVGLLLHCSPPTQGQSRGMGKGVWRPCTAVLSCQRVKTTLSFYSDYNQLVIAIA